MGFKDKTYRRTSPWRRQTTFSFQACKTSGLGHQLHNQIRVTQKGKSEIRIR